MEKLEGSKRERERGNAKRMTKRGEKTIEREREREETETEKPRKKCFNEPFDPKKDFLLSFRTFEETKVLRRYFLTAECKQRSTALPRVIKQK